MNARSLLRGSRNLFSKLGSKAWSAVIQEVVSWLLRTKLAPWVLSMVGLAGAVAGGATATTTLDGLTGAGSEQKPRTGVAVRLIPSPEPVQVAEPAQPLARNERPKPCTECRAYHLECTDDQGNSGRFDVVVFSRAFHWELGSDDAARLNGNERNFLEHLQTHGMMKFLEAPEILAVGTASCEGYEEDPQVEIDRAGHRAQQLVAWIEEVPRSGTVRPLNLGVYAEPCTPSQYTWTQRRIVLVALRERAPGISTRNCLQSALAREPDLRHLATKYQPGFGPQQTFFREAE
jgi:hypothetical protein